MRSDCAASFRRWLRDQGYSAHTIRVWAGYVARAEAWLAREGRPPLRRARPEDVRAFAETLPLTYGSRNGLRSALRAWWLSVGRADPPLGAIRRPRRPRPRCLALEEEEWEKVRLAARHAGPQVYAAVLCLYYLALRREECVRLRWEDFRPRDGGWELHVVGKGGVEAWLPVRPEVTEALAALPRRGPYVFPGRWGGHMAPATLNLWLTAIGDAVGIDLWPHRLRHTALAAANDRTGDLRAVQAFARHADPRTTAIYTRASGRALRRVVEVL